MIIVIVRQKSCSIFCEVVLYGNRGSLAVAIVRSSVISNVVKEGLRLNIFNSNLNTTFVTQRHIHNTLKIGHALIAEGTFYFPAPLAGWFSSLNVNHTTNGVTSKKRALWATKHFNRLDIKEVKDCARVARHKDAVNCDTDSRFNRLFDIVIAQASNRGAK